MTVYNNYAILSLQLYQWTVSVYIYIYTHTYIYMNFSSISSAIMILEKKNKRVNIVLFKHINTHTLHITKLYKIHLFVM